MTEINVPEKEQELIEKINLLELELEKKSTESKNNWELFLRCKADIENIKKRADKEITNISNFSLQNVMTDFIPLLDSFELCIKDKNENDSIKADGILLIHKMLINILEKHNLNKIEVKENEKLDISKHEAISIEYSDTEEDDIIKSVLQNGYMLNDRVLRYVKVSIIKKV
jgi:molecular chaperone GrpE